MIAKKLVIDLCAGLGGFSQAFKDDPDYEVVTIELNKKQRPTICADVRYLPLKKDLRPAVQVASPPCNHWSMACLQFPRIGVKLALEIVGACFEAVAWTKPDKWLIENPRGRLRHIIGKPPQTVRYSDYDQTITMMKTTDFWGNIFLPMVKHERRIPKAAGEGLTRLERLHRDFPPPKPGYLKGNQISGKELQAERAKIPFGVSLAVKQGVEISD